MRLPRNRCAQCTRIIILFRDSESSSSSDVEEFDRDDGHTHDEEGFLAIEGKPGLFYKVYRDK
jgi:hypothetical protein